MIFEWSLPLPNILYFNFWAPEDEDDELSVYSEIFKLPIDFLLLETCKISRNVEYRAFKKIELFPFEAGPDVLSKRLNPRKNLSYSYMRPSINIFICSALQITNLYEYGGSIGSISSLTRIAAHGIDTWFTKEEPVEELVNEFLCGFFTTIGRNCQALEKFYLVIGVQTMMSVAYAKYTYYLGVDLNS